MLYVHFKGEQTTVTYGLFVLQVKKVPPPLLRLNPNLPLPPPQLARRLLSRLNPQQGLPPHLGPASHFPRPTYQNSWPMASQEQL